jgi:hypothetical protein
MKHAQKPWSRWHRPGVAAATVFAAAAMAVTGAVGTGAAHADTLPNGNGVNLGTYAIPTSAPAYQPGGDLLPTGLGTLGNATEMFIPNEPNQDLSVQGGSTAWGTPVVMATSTGAASQTWYFQLVGTVEVGEVEYGTVSDTSYTSVQNVPVYRIINFNGSAPTCLDGYGGGGAAWTNVDSYGCDPNQVNQTNQLWIAEAPTYQGQNDAGGSDYTMLTTMQTSPISSGTVIESLASLVANEWQTSNTPVLSAAVDNIDGYDSTLAELPVTQWPVAQGNSTFILVDPNAQTASGAGGTAACEGMACLVEE